MKDDPLLRPYKLKHLTLKNRIMTTSHEPAYPEEGMPKDRYRAYHEERAKAGVALTMTAGSAVVSRDSPPVFNNILAYKDEVVPWIRELADACHEHGCAVMIQLTHLGRRTHWNKGKLSKAARAIEEAEGFRAARRAHAAVESAINALEVHGLDRCPDHGLEGFKRYVALAMVGRNIQILGAILRKQEAPRTVDPPQRQAA
jgi:hypothetical protein